jgi:hypothetical protein
MVVMLMGMRGLSERRGEECGAAEARHRQSEQTA